MRTNCGCSEFCEKFSEKLASKAEFSEKLTEAITPPALALSGRGGHSRRAPCALHLPRGCRACLWREAG